MTFKWDVYLRLCTGWRKLIGSPKLQIIFHKRAIKCRSLLQKMTYKDKGSYESSPPCTSHNCRQVVHSSEMYILFHIYAYIYIYISLQPSDKERHSIYECVRAITAVRWHIPTRCIYFFLYMNIYIYISLQPSDTESHRK